MTANKNNTSNNQKYEALYTELLDRGDQLHESNKRRIKRGIIILLLLPVILDAIRLLTDSDKVVFLIIWIVIMFALSAYLISVEYLDSAIEKTLEDVTDTEADFDGLLPHPDITAADLHDRIRERLGERFSDRLGAADDEIEAEAEYIEEVVENLEATMDDAEAIAADILAISHVEEPVYIGKHAAARNHTESPEPLQKEIPGELPEESDESAGSEKTAEGREEDAK